jgi:molecular chaperone GrpE (heat shock protein)
MMSTQTEPKIQKWPFFLGDAVLLALACFLESRLPLTRSVIAFVFICCATGAVFAVAPFVLEHKALVQLGEAGTLASAAGQLRDLETLATRVSTATSQWQTVQEHAGKTVGAAKEIADRINAEAAAFTKFLQSANDSERANLRVEIEKLRRTETEWMQVTVRMLDHVFALSQAGVRSGQPALIEQLGQFQDACRDVARRVGLAPFAPAAGEPFNPAAHQLPEGEPQPGAGATVGETIATGYTFQGQLVRAALVSLQSAEAPVAVVPAKEEPSPVEPEEEPSAEPAREPSLL